MRVFRTGVCTGVAAAVLAAGLAANAAAPLDPSQLKRKSRVVPVADIVKKVNEHMEKAWKAAEVYPAAVADDATWARRAYLDLLGRIPTITEITAFLSESGKDKREKLIDTLLATEECAEQMGIFYRNLLVGRLAGQEAAEIGVDTRSFERWAKESFLSNKPWDQWVMEILTAKGSARSNGTSNFFIRVKGEVPEVASRASQLFLGIQIQCAQCHNHPFDEWKQQDFWGIAGFFVRTRVQPAGQLRPGQLYREMQVVDISSSEEAQFYIKNDPRLPRVTQLPKFLKDDAEIIPANAGSAAALDRRFEFARWVTSPDNPYFAKAAVNRMWYYLLGRGIVNPVDDMGSSKRPISVPLLNDMGEDFTRSGFDLKRLLKVIMLSKPYQLSSVVPTTRGKDGKPKPEHGTHFTHYYIKVMTPEQLLYSIVTATGGDEVIRASLNKESIRGTEQYQNEQDDLLRQFTSLIDNDENREVTRFEGSIPLALRMLNGDLVNKRIEAGAPGLQYIMKRGGDPVNNLFLAALSRPAGGVGVARIRSKGTDRLEDIFWALLSSAEFMFIH